MIYKLEDLKGKLTEKVEEVYQVFKDYFGEDRVDLQYEVPVESNIISFMPTTPNNEWDLTDFGIRQIQDSFSNCKADILVYWPQVVVTNENNKSIVIWDVYAKVIIDFTGKIPYEQHGFLLNRSRYNTVQFMSNYMHSHICSIPVNDFSQFQQPCLGTSTLVDTIATLKVEYDPLQWMLFCEEVNVCIGVESLRGVPYRHLEQVGNGRKITEYITQYSISYLSSSQNIRGYALKDLMTDFTHYYLKNGHLKLGFKNGEFVMDMTVYDYIIDISNCFIKFFNEEVSKRGIDSEKVFTSGILQQCAVKNRFFYTVDNPRATASIQQHVGKYICTFKGNRICLTIDDSEEGEQYITTVMAGKYAFFIIKCILKIINTRYEREFNKEREDGIYSRKKAVYI